MRDVLVSEVSLQIRSRWTLFTAGVMVGAAVLAAVASGASVRSMAVSLEAVREAQGADFDAWLATSPDAAIARSELSGVRPERAANLAATVLGAVGPLVFSVWGASVVGCEFARRTARSRAAHEGWKRVVLAKAVVVLGGAAVIAAIVLLAGIGAGRAVWASFSTSSPMLARAAVAVASRSLAPGVAAASIGAAFYGLLACLIALVSRSLAVGVIGGLAIPYIESLIGEWWLPQSALASLLNGTLVYFPGAFVNAPPLKSLPPASWAPWMVMAFWTAAVLICLYVASGRQEID